MHQEPGSSTWRALFQRKSKAQSEDPRERYDARLTAAEAKLDERVRANACPDDKLNNYKFFGRLGRGGFASVYLVTRKSKPKQYALKIISKETLQELRYPSALREKKLQYACQFDFICQVHFAFQDYKHLFITMEYASRGSLRCYLTEKMRMPIWPTKAYAAQVILALQYLHACKILHRDVKPDNLIVFEDGYLKLSDFGLSKKSTKRTFTFSGTPAYMAPEIHESRGYGKFVDWWALGVTIYELLYGYRPFVPGTGIYTLKFPAYADTNSPTCCFLKALLTTNFEKRLGYHGNRVQNMMNHEWFENLNFYEVFSKSYKLDYNYVPDGPLKGKRYDFCTKDPKRDPAIPWLDSF